MRKQRTDYELLQASEHLAHEVSMMNVLAEAQAGDLVAPGSPTSSAFLKEASKACSQDLAKVLPEAISNAFLEAFIIHFRCILTFLCQDKNPKEDDVIASDYFGDPGKWKEVRGNMPPVLADAKTDAHKTLAHLTYKRLALAQEEKRWEFSLLSNEINKVLRQFRTHADHNKLSLLWREPALDKNDAVYWANLPSNSSTSTPISIFYTEFLHK